MTVMNNNDSIDMKELRERMAKRRERMMEEIRENNLAPFATAIESAEYDFPTKHAVPPGIYVSEVKKVSTRTKYDKPILDVGYEITADNGDVYRIRQSYPLKSVPLQRLHDAMINAGLKAGDSPSKYIGVKEKIELGYTSKSSDFGSIVYREPFKEAEDEESMDDEFDAFLEEDLDDDYE